MSTELNEFLSQFNVRTFRSLFYFVTPTETSFESVNAVPPYTEQASGWFLVLLLIEFTIIWLRKKEKHDDGKSKPIAGFALNDTITSLNAGMFSLLFKFGGRTASLGIYMYIYDNYRLIDLPWNSTWTWVICFLTEDLCYYLGHRFIHEAGVFWSFHQMHHSSEYYNLSTALRQGCIQDVAMISFDLLQSPFIPPQVFLVHRYLNVLYQFWIHTEIIDNLGPFEYIFNTPSHHRVHHGRNPYCIDKNYGGTLIIWDRLFGTFEAERKEEHPVYGLVDNVRSFNQIWCQFFEFKSLGYDKGQMVDAKSGTPTFPGFANKIRAAVYPPGYFPGTAIRRFYFWFCMQNPEDGIPKIEDKIIRYNPPISTPTMIYCFVQFVHILAVFMTFVRVRKTMDYDELALNIAFMLITMQTLGAFFDKKSYAETIEFLRLAVTMAVSVAWSSSINVVLSLISTIALVGIVTNAKRNKESVKND